jgi:hypothetical protein
MASKLIAIYAGRFHPFHKGHKAVYDSLVSKFGVSNVFVATSDKQEPGTSPFTFKEKSAMMMLTGVPGSAIKQEKSPYKPENTLSSFDKNTAVIFAVGQKDMDENPRFKPGTKKDGSPTYYQPLAGKSAKELEGYEKHGYLVVSPTVKFSVLGKPATSATELRKEFTTLDDEQRKEFIKDLFGTYNDVIHKVMNKRLAESMAEGKSPHKKGTTKYKKHMAAMHAEDKFEPHTMYKDGKSKYASTDKEHKDLGKKGWSHDNPKTKKVEEVTSDNKGVDLVLPRGKIKVLKAEDKDYDRGVLIELLEDGGYDMAYWYNEFKTYPVEVLVDGKSIKKDAKKVTMKYHPELEEDFNYGDKNDPKSGKSYINRNHPEFRNRVYGGDKGIIVKQIKRLSNVITDISRLAKDKAIDKDTMATILSQLDQIKDFLRGTPVEEKFNRFLESLYALNKTDPMDSEILIQGLGRMTLKQAVKRVHDYADEIKNVASNSDPYWHQTKLTHHIEMLGHYNKAVQDAYKELANIRKKGGTRSKGIDSSLTSEAEVDGIEKDASEIKLQGGITPQMIAKQFPNVADKVNLLQVLIKMRRGDNTYTRQQMIAAADAFKELLAKDPNETQTLMMMLKRVKAAEADVYKTNIKVGDQIKVGRFKNRKAEIKDITKDDNGQPVLKTTKGDQKLFKPRIVKLEGFVPYDEI